MSNKVSIIFSCLIAAVAVRANQQNRDAVLVNLYHGNLDFFDSFLSPGEIDGLQYSAENIPSETIKILRRASNSYSSMRGCLLQWCVEVNDTFDFPAENFNLLISRDEFVTNVNRRINEIKTYFDSIATNEHISNTNTKNKKENPRPDGERSQGRASVTGNIKMTSKSPIKENNSQKKATKSSVSQSQEKWKRQADGAENKPKTFEEKMNYAKSLIDKAFNVIRKIYKDENKSFNKKETVTSCKPILEKLDTPLTEPPQYTPPPRTVTLSREETLRVFSRSRNNGWPMSITHEKICEAILSKSTMEQFVKVYRLEKTLANFFNAFDSVDSTKECKARMQSFITNSYMSWAYEVPKMTRTEFLKISICLNTDRSAEVTIVI